MNTDFTRSKHSNTLIKQPYAITVAKHNFNVHEMRVMTRITQALQKDMMYGKTRLEVQKTLFGDKIIRIPTQSLLPKGSRNYGAVRRALRSLEEKSMLIRGKDKHGSYEATARLIMKSKYYLNNEMVEIQIDRDILPDYLALASYSKYVAEVSFDSSSRYIMRMYQFISHWKDKTKKVVTLDELRDVLELGDKYSKPKDLRKHILEPCIADLKKRADVWFEIEAPTKAGRSITGYVFRIYNRTTDLRNAEVHSINIQNILKTAFGLRAYHLEQLHEILNKSEYHAHIYQKLKDVDEQISSGKVKNIQAYVVRTLQNEFGLVGEGSKTYKTPEKVRDRMAEKVRKYFQAGQGIEKSSAERRSTGSGFIGEQTDIIIQSLKEGDA